MYVSCAGPNEAGEPGLRHVVERLLDGVAAVLYVLDYTKASNTEFMPFWHT